MKKSDLIALTAEKTGISKAEAQKVVEALLNSIKEVLSRKDKVSLKGFGTFRLRSRASRKIRSLHSEDIITIPASMVPVFKPGKKIIDRVNSTGNGHDSKAVITNRVNILNNYKQNKHNLLVRARNFFAMFFTSLAWLIIMALGLWVMASIGWYLLFLLWKKELLIPAAISMTVIALFYIILIAFIIFVSLYLWTKINYFTYHKKNRRKIFPLKTEAPVFDWSEALIDTEKVDYHDLAPGSDLLIIKDKKNGLP